MTYSIASLRQSLTAASPEIRIMPAGVFRSIDGRPVGLAGWMINAEIAARIIADIATRDDLVIDYEHQTQLAKQNGQPAPAAGWFNRVVWREGQGLFAVDVKWTEKAKRMIDDGEYRYISPAFTFSAETGHVGLLVALGLTNTPGLNGLADLSNVAVNFRQHDPAPSAQRIAKAATAYQEQQATLGVHVSTVQAIGHVQRSAARPVASLSAATAPSSTPKPTSPAALLAKAATAYQKQQAEQGVHVSIVQAVGHVQRSAEQRAASLSAAIAPSPAPNLPSPATIEDGTSRVYSVSQARSLLLQANNVLSAAESNGDLQTKIDLLSSVYSTCDAVMRFIDSHRQYVDGLTKF